MKTVWTCCCNRSRMMNKLDYKASALYQRGGIKIKGEALQRLVPIHKNEQCGFCNYYAISHRVPKEWTPSDGLAGL